MPPSRKKDREIAALKATIDQNAQALEIALLKERQQAKEATQAKDVEIASLKSQAKLVASEAALREKSLQTENMKANCRSSNPRPHPVCAWQKK